MSETIEKPRISRRDLLKRSAAAGGVVWVSPTLRSQPAWAVDIGACSDCPDGAAFRFKTSTHEGCACDPGGDSGEGNCLAGVGATKSCCLVTAGVVSVICETGKETWTLAAGIQFCRVDVKCASACISFTASGTSGVATATVTVNPDQTTTVVIGCSSISHSELVVCVRGSIPSTCLPS
jgi:hypothetical protein